MRWIIVITVLLALQFIAAHGKTVVTDKKTGKTKKAVKPTKSPKAITDYFTNLSPDDKAFIKALDKQFNKHGDKIKIKVERENGTTAGKNIKRGLDGELGYAYNTNSHAGYYFMYDNSKGLNGPGHRYTNAPIHKEIATDIEIQKSRSYELPPERVYSASPAYVHHQEIMEEDEVPVIVLRIPGPAKYAKHLQALLQQYLELRAAQYLKALEEQERQAYYMHYMTQQYAYYPRMVPVVATAAPVAPVAPVTPVPMHAHYYQPQQYHAMYYEPSPQQQYHVPTGYQGGYMVQVQPLVKSANDYHGHAAVTPDKGGYESQEYIQPSGYVKPHSYDHSESYDYSATNYNHQQHHSSNEDTQQQQQYDEPVQPHSYEPEPEQHHGYEQESESHQADAVEHSEEQQSHNEEVEYASVVPLKTVENYPSDKHTQVIFKHDNRAPYTVYKQPQYVHNEEQIIVQDASAPDVVEITQRPIHNYHAHPLQSPNRKRETPYTQEQFKKYNRLIQRLKKQPRPTRESSEKKTDE